MTISPATSTSIPHLPGPFDASRTSEGYDFLFPMLRYEPWLPRGDSGPQRLEHIRARAAALYERPTLPGPVPAASTFLGQLIAHDGVEPAQFGGDRVGARIDEIEQVSAVRAGDLLHHQIPMVASSASVNPTSAQPRRRPGVAGASAWGGAAQC